MRFWAIHVGLQKFPRMYRPTIGMVYKWRHYNYLTINLKVTRGNYTKFGQSTQYFIDRSYAPECYETVDLHVRLMIRLTQILDTSPSRYSSLGCGAWWFIGRFGAFRPKGRGFISSSIRHVRTLGKSFTRNCLWRFSVKLRHSIRAESERH